MKITWHTWQLENMPPLVLHEMLALRQAVFVVEQYCPYLDADSKDKDAWHLLGYQANILVAYTRLLPEGISYPKAGSIGRVVTSEAVRGTGVGRLLMEESLREYQKLFGDTAIRISAQAYLTDFYASFGFTSVGSQYLEDGIPHIEMLKKY